MIIPCPESTNVILNLIFRVGSWVRVGVRFLIKRRIIFVEFGHGITHLERKVAVVKVIS